MVTSDHVTDGSHNIRSAIAEKPKLHVNSMTLCFIELELLSIAVLHCRNRDFYFLLLWPWPHPNDLHIRTWPVFPGYIPDIQI